ncbi:AgrD family cyclic lactone autoinducer peptide [Candidatus Stoquefichus sp. SB1]
MFFKSICTFLDKLARTACYSHSFIGCYEPEKPKILEK